MASSSPVIIGFGYRLQNGKDTVVQSILDGYGSKYDMKRYAFADDLKEEVAGKEMDLCIKYDIEPDPENKWRNLLQFWGQFRREQDEFYWIKKVANKLDIDQPRVALISDVRYRNEATFIKDRDGFLVKVTRTGYVDVTSNNDHQSEHDLDYYPFDYEVIQEDGKVEDLKLDALELFQLIEKELDVVGEFLRMLRESEVKG